MEWWQAPSHQPSPKGRGSSRRARHPPLRPERPARAPRRRRTADRPCGRRVPLHRLARPLPWRGTRRGAPGEHRHAGRHRAPMRGTRDHDGPAGRQYVDGRRRHAGRERHAARAVPGTDARGARGRPARHDADRGSRPAAARCPALGGRRGVPVAALDLLGGECHDRRRAGGQRRRQPHAAPRQRARPGARAGGGVRRRAGLGWAAQAAKGQHRLLRCGTCWWAARARSASSRRPCCDWCRRQAEVVAAFCAVPSPAAALALFARLRAHRLRRAAGLRVHERSQPRPRARRTSRVRHCRSAERAPHYALVVLATPRTGATTCGPRWKRCWKRHSRRAR